MCVVLRPEGYVGLVDHALAEREVGVRQIGQSLEQNLCRDGGLEVRRVELVPENTSARPVNQTQSFYRGEITPLSCCWSFVLRSDP